MFQKGKIAVLFVGLSILLTSCGDPLGEKYSAFAKCLTAKNAVMYGAYWCPHCADQKKMFGETAFENVRYVECDPRGENANPELCKEKKIEGYPAWDFSDGSRISGKVPLQKLSEKTGCPLPTETSANP